MLKRIICLLFISASSLAASSDDHFMIRSGDATLSISWTMMMAAGEHREELYNYATFWPLISTFAENEAEIKKAAFEEYFSLFYSEGEWTARDFSGEWTLNSDSLSSLIDLIERTLKKKYSLKSVHKEEFLFYRMHIPYGEGNEGWNEKTVESWISIGAKPSYGLQSSRGFILIFPSLQTLEKKLRELEDTGFSLISQRVQRGTIHSFVHQ